MKTLLQCCSVSVAAILIFVPTNSASGQIAQVAPTVEEARDQANRLLPLEESSRQLREASDETRVLRERISVLETDAQRNAAELARLRAEQTERREQEERRIRLLRETTVPEWAGVVVGLSDGLEAARGIGQIGEITLLVRPNDGPGWTRILDYVGRGFAGLASAVAVAAPEGDTRQDAMRVAAGGLVTYFLGNTLRSRLQGQNSGEMKVFVERVSMHRTFASDVFALNAAVTDVATRLEPVAERGRALLQSSDPCRYRTFVVNDDHVKEFRTATESYSILVSSLLNANHKAAELRQQNWTTQISDDLARVENATASAIRRWREQVLLSQRLLDNLTELAERDQQLDGPLTCG